MSTDLPLGTDEVTQLTEKVDAVSVYDQDERELSELREFPTLPAIRLAVSQHIKMRCKNE